jgi:FkbM family methyltransferase
MAQREFFAESLWVKSSTLLNLVQRVLEPLPARGKGRVSHLIFRLRPVEEAECHPLPNITVFVRPDKWIERLMWAGAYERELVGLFKRVLTPGMTVLDLGANVGYFAALAAGLVGNNGEVHAFEPERTCFARLERNLAAFPWAHAHCNAVGDRGGEARFYSSENPNETGWGSLLLEGDASARQVSVVPVIKLDEWICERAIDRVDFIKMDIEGGEFRALQGMETLLNRFRPIIVAELNSICLERDDRKPDDVLALLHAANYDTFSFNDGVLALPAEKSDKMEAIAAQSGARRDKTPSLKTL